MSIQPIPPTGPMHYRRWDQYVAEAHRDIPTFTIEVAPGDLVEILCPSGDALIRMSEAEDRDDFVALTQAVFGAAEPRVRELLADADFPVLMRLVRDVMSHYGQPLGATGESAASSS